MIITKYKQKENEDTIQKLLGAYGHTAEVYDEGIFIDALDSEGNLITYQADGEERQAIYNMVDGDWVTVDNDGSFCIHTEAPVEELVRMMD